MLIFLVQKFIRKVEGNENHPLGSRNICSKLNGNLTCSCWDISLWSKVFFFSWKAHWALTWPMRALDMFTEREAPRMFCGLFRNPRESCTSQPEALQTNHQSPTQTSQRLVWGNNRAACSELRHHRSEKHLKIWSDFFQQWHTSWIKASF